MGKMKRRLNSPKYAKKYATVRAAIAKARGFFEEIITPAEQEPVEVVAEAPAPAPVAAEAPVAELVVAEGKKPVKKKTTRKPRKITAKKKTTKKTTKKQ